MGSFSRVDEAIAVAWDRFLDERGKSCLLDRTARADLDPEWRAWLSERGVPTDAEDGLPFWNPADPPQGRSEPWPCTLLIPREVVLKVATLGCVPSGCW